MISDKNEDGLAIPFILLLILLAAVVIVGGIMYFQHHDAKGVVPVTADTCRCADIADLENRLNEANAAVAEYQVAIQEVKDLAVKNGKPTMYSDDLYTYEQSNVQLAINAVTKAGTHKASGETDSACETNVKADTPCLTGSVQSHENVHSSSCQDIKKKLVDEGRYTGIATNYKNSMTMEEYWNNEIAAYTAEIAYLNKNLASARADAGCEWTCDVDKKSYKDHAECERSCRPTLGSTIKTGFRCTNKAAP